MDKKSELISNLPAKYASGTGYSLRSCGGISSARNCYILSFKLEDSACELFVKESPYVEPEGNALNILNRLLQKTELQETIPVLVKVLDSQKVIITSYLKNHGRIDRSLIQLPLLDKYDDNEVDQAGSNVGAWLAKFQTLVGAHSEQDDLLYIVKDIETRISEHSQFSDKFQSLLSERLHALSTSVGKLPLVYAHGDFTPRNILVANESVRVIDWEMMPQQLMPYLYDAHYFCVTLHKRFVDWFPQKNRTQRMIQNFWGGYFSEIDTDKCKIREQWTLTRLLVLCMIHDREVKANRRLRSKLMGTRTRFIASLKSEIESGIDQDYKLPH